LKSEATRVTLAPISTRGRRTRRAARVTAMKKNVSQRLARARMQPTFRERIGHERWSNLHRYCEAVGPWAFEDLPQWLQDAVLEAEAEHGNRD
jgi:hypothetical protein